MLDQTIYYAEWAHRYRTQFEFRAAERREQQLRELELSRPRAAAGVAGAPRRWLCATLRLLGERALSAAQRLASPDTDFASRQT